MAKSSTAAELGKYIEQLRQERASHVQAIEEIDATFRQFGITSPAPSRRGRKPGRKAAKATASTSTKGRGRGRRGKRTRGRFEVSGEESVVNFIREAGNPTTAEINEHWTSEGRGGKADNALTKLVAANVLKREKIPGKRGSTYSIA